MKKLLLFIFLSVLFSCSQDTSPETPAAEIIPLSATFTQVNVAVYNGNTGSVTIKPTGGTPPYTITPSQTGLTAKNYTFVITDSKGLTTTINATITQPGKPVLPQSSLLKAAIRNINKASVSGKTKVIKRVIKSVEYEKSKYITDPSSDFSATDNLYSSEEDALNTNTPKGDIRTYSYNASGQLTQISVVRAPGSMGESGIESSYEYDSDGNVVNSNTPYTYENGLITQVSKDGYVTKYTYDTEGRIIHRQGQLNASVFEYTNDEVKETRYEVTGSGEIPNGRVVITKYDKTKAGIYNNEPYYKIATTFSTLLGQTVPNPYLHIIEQKIIDNGSLSMSQSYKYFYDVDGYLIKVDDGAYVTIYQYE
ncbi:MAG: SprB repeat-containing protein [Flavobacterium circumlabens]|uniref:SprB repeat-containing protein n=1 Tax=Flavobacterium circumlabens TaxID=2133765 RepID=UPI003264E3E8